MISSSSLDTKNNNNPNPKGADSNSSQIKSNAAAEEQKGLLSPSEEEHPRVAVDSVIENTSAAALLVSSDHSGGDQGNSMNYSNSGSMKRKNVGGSSNGSLGSAAKEGASLEHVPLTSSFSAAHNGHQSASHDYNESSSVSLVNPEIHAKMMKQKAVASVGIVKQKWFGTGPFDKYWLNTDCCGLFCAGFTYSLHMYGCFAVCLKLLKPWFFDDEDGNNTWDRTIGTFHVVLFCSIAILACVNHFFAMTTNPGAVPPDATPLPDPETGITISAKDLNPTKLGRRYCRRCTAFKPKRAHHCSICKRCIVKMDHHCPWVNNCVGIGNHKFFLLFVFFTLCSCLYSFLLLFYRGWHCSFVPSKLTKSHCFENPSDVSYLIGLALESLLFGLFTSCMVIDQFETVSTNLTQIDRMKGESFNNDLPDVNEVFGGNGIQSGFRLDWLAPIAVKFPASVRDEIYGFCIPCTTVADRISRNGDVEMSSLKKSDSLRPDALDIV